MDTILVALYQAFYGIYKVRTEGVVHQLLISARAGVFDLCPLTFPFNGDTTRTLNLKLT